MGFGYDENENIGVEKTSLGEFFLCLEDQLRFVSGLLPLEDGLELEDVLRPNLVVGDPGVGKTCGIISVIDKVNKELPPEKKFGMKKILLGQTVVGSLEGIPVVNNSTGEVVRVQMPDLPVAERDGEYGVLFLDEITTADEAQIQPALGLADDTRSIGTYTLPEHWVVVAAGNGPSCANFLQLHDMTLSRFVAFDIQYDYKKDWRAWAHANNINNLIIAFLNFSPDWILKVITSDGDKSGKQFACPRTWSRLSKELTKRAIAKRPVGQGELQSFASRIIGIDAARAFASFASFSSKISISPDDIIDGKVTKGDPNTTNEEFHIIIQQLFKRIQAVLKNTKDSDGCYPEDTYIKVANMVTYIISFSDFSLDNSVGAIRELFNEVPDARDVVGDNESFPSYCPAFEDFIFKYSDVILNEDVDLNSI